MTEASANTSKTLKKAGLVMAIYLLGSVLGLLRVVLVTRQFGLSADHDAYVVAFRIPDLLFNVIAGGALGSAFLPVFAGLIAKDEKAKAWRVASGVLNSLLLVVSILALLAALFAPWLVANILVRGWANDATKIALTSNLIRVLLVSTLIFSISGLLMGILNTFEQFLLPALATLMYNLGIILGALASMFFPQFGVYNLAGGVVLGALGHLILQLPGVLRHQPRYQPALGWELPEVRQVGKLMGPRMLGSAVWEVNFWVNTMLASLLPEGSAAALGVAFQIFTTPQIIISRAVATVVFPTFSAQAARGEYDQLSHTFRATLRTVSYLALPAMLGMVWYSSLVANLFHSQRFTAQNSALLAWVLAAYSLGLVSHSVLELLTRVFFALKNTRLPVFVGLLAMLINVSLSYAFYRLIPVHLFAYPAAGLALANTIATTLECVALFVFLRQYQLKLNGWKFLREIFPQLLATLAMLAVLAGWRLLAAPVNVWLELLGGITLGSLIYFALTFAMHSPEARSLPPMAGGLVRRLRGYLSR